MNVKIVNGYIPGTILKRTDMGDVTGMAFLDKIFFITDGIMLSQIREISGIDGTTLQNWVKRGWICNPKQKKYSKDQLARILIINMLRKNMQLERIDFLLRYINGKPDCREDDIVPESVLYDYISKVVDMLTDMPGNGEGGISTRSLTMCIDLCIRDYTERIPGSKKRLRAALEIIVLSYYSVLIAEYTDLLYKAL